MTDPHPHERDPNAGKFTEWFRCPRLRTEIDQKATVIFPSVSSTEAPSCDCARTCGITREDGTLDWAQCHHHRLRELMLAAGEGKPLPSQARDRGE
jgi:hypothetical protein